MSDTPENQAAGRIVEAIRSAFPAEAALVDADVLRDCYDQNAYFIWVERFSQLTTDAIGRRGFAKASAHLKLLARLLASGDAATLHCIDVAYVESLMWDAKDDKVKREGWKLIPANLRALYVSMWGEKPFMKGAK